VSLSWVLGARLPGSLAQPGGHKKLTTTETLGMTKTLSCGIWVLRKTQEPKDAKMCGCTHI
jgi:hypothetical protein